MGMVVTESTEQIRSFVTDARHAGLTVGFVPTMGALHEGHWSLVARARAECRVVVVSIFVNPLQFGVGEDFDAYPRHEQDDLDGCRRRDVDVVFLPVVEGMCNSETLTSVRVAQLTDHLCGAFRPGHFDGVCTIVCKLFNIVQPDRAYFGEKDYQQLMVVRRMVRDLSIPVDVIGCPIVREDDGLARSSRNAHLSPENRKRATVIHAALMEAVEAIDNGQRDARVIVDTARRRIEDGGACSVDYVAVVDADTLEELMQIDRSARICVAVRFDGVRLIDNVAVDCRGSDG